MYDILFASGLTRALAFWCTGTYPNGMFPSKTAIVENFRSYKNQGGFLLRHTGNIVLKGKVEISIQVVGRPVRQH
jgi:hypothetical protein